MTRQFWVSHTGAAAQLTNQLNQIKQGGIDQVAGTEMCATVRRANLNETDTHMLTNRTVHVLSKRTIQ